MVDIENLMGGPYAGPPTMHMASRLYREVAHVGEKDQIIVAANPGLALDVWNEWKGAQLLFGKGPNGADKALLATLTNPEEIASRFDRVVIGSGDGAFWPTVLKIQASGIAVGVIGRTNGVSRMLAHAADFLILNVKYRQ